MKLLPIALALALAGCADTPAPGDPASPPIGVSGPATVVDLAALRLLSETELTYNTVASVALAATRSGLIKPGSATALHIADLNGKTTRALDAARAAANATDRLAALALASSYTAQISTATPQEK